MSRILYSTLLMNIHPNFGIVNDIKANNIRSNKHKTNFIETNILTTDSHNIYGPQIIYNDTSMLITQDSGHILLIGGNEDRIFKLKNFSSYAQNAKRIVITFFSDGTSDKIISLESENISSPPVFRFSKGSRNIFLFHPPIVSYGTSASIELINNPIDDTWVVISYDPEIVTIPPL